MTLEQAIQTVRIALGDRNEHHPNCTSQTSALASDRRCDCYAARRQLPHKALDMIEQEVKDAKA